MRGLAERNKIHAIFMKLTNLWLTSYIISISFLPFFLMTSIPLLLFLSLPSPLHFHPPSSHIVSPVSFLLLPLIIFFSPIPTVSSSTVCFIYFSPPHTSSSFSSLSFCLLSFYLCLFHSAPLSVFIRLSILLHTSNSLSEYPLWYTFQALLK